MESPEWMPSPAEVARARADLERRGVVQSMTRDLAGAQMVPAGETPWAWLIGAALWITIWPAVIALRLGTDRLDWLPWWLPIVLAVLHMLVQAGPVRVAERELGPGLAAPPLRPGADRGANAGARPCRIRDLGRHVV